MRALRAPTAFVALAASLAVGPTTGRAQTLEGILLERGTDRPIALGLMTLLTLQGDSVASALTDENGRFRLVAPEPGEFAVAGTALGYESTLARSAVTLPEGSWMSIEFRIRPQAIEIGGLTIETRSSLLRQPRLVQNGFVERAQRGFGRFITPVDIAESNALRTSDLLQRTGRVTTRYDVGGDRVLMRGTGGYCTPLLYVDGMRTPLGDWSIDILAPIDIIEAVEVYRSANEAPLRYGGGMGGCGVIVIWTRTR